MSWLFTDETPVADAIGTIVPVDDDAVVVCVGAGTSFGGGCSPLDCAPVPAPVLALLPVSSGFVGVGPVVACERARMPTDITMINPHALYLRITASDPHDSKRSIHYANSV